MKKLILKARVETVNGKLVLIIPVETSSAKVTVEKAGFNLTYKNVNLISRMA